MMEEMIIHAGDNNLCAFRDKLAFAVLFNVTTILSKLQLSLELPLPCWALSTTRHSKCIFQNLTIA